jgi:hypothetical protein
MTEHGFDVFALKVENPVKKDQTLIVGDSV